MSAVTAWGQMIARCYDPQHHKYPRYGGRGIRVCDRWICRRLFVEDMGARPQNKTLNRIDNDGDYCPENCEWASYEIQSRNMSGNRLITYGGETKCVTDWAKLLGVSRRTLSKRFEQGWTVEAAFTVPVSASNKSGRQAQ
jgi:hypothetical protein